MWANTFMKTHNQLKLTFRFYDDSLTSPYGHLYNMDTSLLWAVCLVSEKPKIIHSLPL